MLADIYQSFVLKKPKTIFLALILILSGFMYHAKDFRLDASSDTLLIEGDPDLEYLREITDREELVIFSSAAKTRSKL